MSQRVPSWDLEDPLLHHRHEKLASLPPADATSAYNEIAELTWKDGHLATLGIRQHRVGKPIPRYPCPAASSAVGGGETLECIVDQARRASSNPDLLSWLGGAHSAAADALVPCAEAGSRKRGRAAEMNCPSQGSTTPRSARKVETCELTAARDGVGEEEAGFSTSVEVEEEGGGGGLPETENGSFAGGGPLVVDEHDSVCHSLRSQANFYGDGFGERGVTSISTKRSRVAAVHNQSERKRRDRINQKMKTLQKLLPNSNKTDKASMLDEVIDYLKLLQAQVQMMRTIPTMMLPISMQQQQFQMSLMAQMAQMTQMARMTRMGMGLGMMDPSLLGGPGCTGLTPPPPILHPSTFLPLPSTATGAWEAQIAEWMGQPGCRVLPADMFSAFMGCPAQQPMSTEAYSRMATLYQKLYQQPLGSNQKA